MGDRPDQIALAQSLQGRVFQSGVALGRWRHIRTEWPYCFLAIRAADRQEFVLRCECTGFPSIPTAEPWDLAAGTLSAAEKRPRGIGNVRMVFRTDWEGGRHLYHPLDRIAANGHPNWVHEHPSLVWSRERGIAQLAEAIHRLLNGDEYGAV